MKEKIINNLSALLYHLGFNLIIFSLGMAFIVVFIVPFFVFFRTGLIRLVPEMDLIYKTIKFVLFSATSVSIIVWIGTFFPDDSKTKKYWWNKELNKKDEEK